MQYVNNYLLSQYSCENNNTCLICWETDNLVKSMKSNYSLAIYCNCDAYFHPKCFDDWLCEHLSCPICRKMTIIYRHSYLKSIVLILKNIDCSFFAKVIKNTFLVSAFILFTNYYLLMLISMEMQYDNLRDKYAIK